jgi:hypothetical protein
VPTLTHVIKDDGRGPVVGLTLTDTHLFVLCSPSQQKVQVYDSITFIRQPALQVKGLSDKTDYSGLASCVTNNCIFVSDPGKDTVHKVSLSGKHSFVVSWPVGRSPTGMSINTRCNLLVACSRAGMIQEYTINGSLVREIHLQSNNDELQPLHSIQLISGQLLVSCWNRKPRPHSEFDVVEMDTNGRIATRYSTHLRSTSHQKFNSPCHLAADKNNECILVADSLNNRIIKLNRSPNHFAREFNAMSVDGGLQKPTGLCYDWSKNRLIVGEYRSPYRVLVFDNVQ